MEFEIKDFEEGVEYVREDCGACTSPDFNKPQFEHLDCKHGMIVSGNNGGYVFWKRDESKKKLTFMECGISVFDFPINGVGWKVADVRSSIWHNCLGGVRNV